MAMPRFAIVGTGNMAATMMNALSDAGVRVNAVASRTPERAAAFARSFGIAPGASDLKSVLERADVDAVYVANTPKEHAATVIAALCAGKSVLCEKPMATTELELAQIVERAEQTGVLCMEALWTLCLPAYCRFFEYANSGKWGEPRSLNASFSYPTSEADHQRSESAVGSGVLLDRSIYLIALALKVFGSVKTIASQIHFNALGTDTDAFLQLTHESGAHSQLAASFHCLMPNNANLHCSQGLIELQAPLIGAEALSTHRTNAQHASSPAEAHPSFSDRLKQKLRQNRHIRRLRRTLDGSISHQSPYENSSYLPQLKHFIGLHQTSKTQSDIVPLSLSLEVMQIIDKARKLSIG